LIEQQDIAVSAHRIKGSARLQIQIDRAATRAAINQHNGIERGVGSQRRNAGDEQIERGSVRIGIVERHGKRGATAESSR